MTEFEDRMSSLRERFRERCRDRADRLRSALASADPAALGALAHDLAGSAGIFGFDELSREAQSCELAARDPATGKDELRSRGSSLLLEVEKIAGEAPE